MKLPDEHAGKLLMKEDNTVHGAHKVGNLEEAQLRNIEAQLKNIEAQLRNMEAKSRNIVQEAIIAILAAKELTKESLLADFQKMIEAAIEKIVPVHDRDEDVPFNVTQAANYFKVTRQVITKYQKVIVNGEPVLKFNSMGQISLAQCRRVLNSGIIRPRPNVRKKKK